VPLLFKFIVFFQIQVCVVISLPLTFSQSFARNITDYVPVASAIKTAVFRSTAISTSNVLVAKSDATELCGIPIPPLYKGDNPKREARKMSDFGKLLLQQEEHFNAKRAELLTSKKLFLSAVTTSSSTVSFAIVQNVEGTFARSGYT
jgi:hypothetical protein